MRAQQVYDQYRPDGRAPAGPFVAWSAVVLLASVVGAVALYGLFRAGFYFVVLVPLMFAIGMSGLMFLHVVRSHCRSRTAAALVGLAAGLVMYLGYYHAGMLASLGINQIHRVDLLPSYISFRINTDVIEHSPSAVPKDDGEPEPLAGHEIVMNWVVFLIELGFCAICPLLAGWLRADRPYCVRCDKWMRQDRIFFDAASAPAIAAALDTDELEELAELRRAIPQARVPITVLALTHCAAETNTGLKACPAYISVKRIRDSNPVQVNPHRTMRGGLVRDRLLLESQKGALIPLFPELARDVDPALARKVETRVEAERQDRRQEVQGASIREELFDAGSRGVLTKINVFKATVLSLVPLLLILVAFVPFIVGLVFVLDLYEPIEGEELPNWPAPLRWTLLVGGGILCAAASYWLFTHLTEMRDRFYRRKTRECVLERDEFWIDPDDPEAYFVEIVPRKNWGKVQAESATDFGFLRCDAPRGALYFEGDRRRICIPVETISYCGSEPIIDATGKVFIHATVVESFDGTTRLELPFIPYFPPWTFGRKPSLRRAEHLRDQIHSCLSAGTPETLDAPSILP